MIIEELMSPNPITIDAAYTVREAIRRMLTEDIRHLPVLKRGLLIGMLSDRDVRGLASGMVAGESLALSAPVFELMTGDPLTVSPRAPIGEAIDLMIEHKVGALPVVDEDELVGILSYVDVLRAARTTIDAEL